VSLLLRRLLLLLSLLLQVLVAMAVVARQLLSCRVQRHASAANPCSDQGV
jgi:hypothetical protein